MGQGFHGPSRFHGSVVARLSCNSAVAVNVSGISLFRGAPTRFSRAKQHLRFFFSSKEGIPSISHVLSSCLLFQTHLQYVKVDFCISPCAREHYCHLHSPSKQLCSSLFIKRMNVRVKCLTLVAARISDLQER